jgi:hypothetical protein
MPGLHENSEAGLGQIRPQEEPKIKPRFDDVELATIKFDDVELVDFKSEVEEEITKRLVMLKYGEEVEIGELIPGDKVKIDTLVSMAMRMRGERKNTTAKDLAEVVVQEYLSGNNGSKPWILK